MKKIHLTCAAVAATLSLLATPAMAASMKVVNDTSSGINLHTGSGIAKLPSKGSSTSFTCKPGKKIHRAERGSKKEVLFTVKAEHCGKTNKLSDLM